MRFLVSILMYGQIVTAWLLMFVGIAMCFSIFLTNDREKRKWIGYSGMLLQAFSVFIMIHYFTSNANGLTALIKVLYETYPDIVEKIL